MAASTVLHLKISGMHCDACIRRVKNSLAGVPGVQVEQVQIGAARLQYDPERLDAQTIVNAIAKAGFEAQASA